MTSHLRVQSYHPKAWHLHHRTPSTIPFNMPPSPYQSSRQYWRTGTSSRLLLPYTWKGRTLLCVYSENVILKEGDPTSTGTSEFLHPKSHRSEQSFVPSGSAARNGFQLELKNTKSSFNCNKSWNRPRKLGYQLNQPIEIGSKKSGFYFKNFTRVYLQMLTWSGRRPNSSPGLWPRRAKARSNSTKKCLGSKCAKMLITPKKTMHWRNVGFYLLLQLSWKTKLLSAIISDWRTCFGQLLWSTQLAPFPRIGPKLALVWH